MRSVLKFYLNIFLLQASEASISMAFVSATPLYLGFSIDSMTALATTSALIGNSTAAPANEDSLPPVREFAKEPIVPAKAIGRVNRREESYRNPGLINTLRSLGNEEAIVDSASLLVVMYRLGSIGAPAAAEMKTKVGTPSWTASCAKVMASNTLSLACLKPQ